ncbi:UNVERIFIED_CONTAM: hypothetical protein HDU68_006393 [Siphonaria sp. JEL0065]|nr:hypothetical protein HDU68_006393 [Siphonaria sp. JEL0065]
MQIIKLALFAILAISCEAASRKRAPGKRDHQQVLACGTGLTMCATSIGPACVDTLKSENHCGSCGMFCPGHCLGGECTSLKKRSHY